MRVLKFDSFLNESGSVKFADYYAHVKGHGDKIEAEAFRDYLRALSAEKYEEYLKDRERHEDWYKDQPLLSEEEYCGTDNQLVGSLSDMQCAMLISLLKYELYKL